MALKYLTMFLNVSKSIVVNGCKMVDEMIVTYFTAISQNLSAN